MSGGTDASRAYDGVLYTRGSTVDRAHVGALVRSAVDGDAAAWKALVEGLSPLVWSVVRAYRLSDADAHEVYQTVWLRFSQHLRRIRDPEKADSWLASTARHECLKVLKSLSRRTPTDDPMLLDRVSEDRTPEQSFLDLEEAAAETERIRHLWQEFEELGYRCRQLLRVLMSSPPPSYREVSAALGIAVGSVGPMRQRCSRRLRTRLEAVGVSVGTRSRRRVAGGPEQSVPPGDFMARGPDTGDLVLRGPTTGGTGEPSAAVMDTLSAGALARCRAHLTLLGSVSEVV